MANKKNTKASGSKLPTLKIGSRVRCTDDGVVGRITWANGVAVKVQWDDGEQVTWRRDELTQKPVEILDAAHDEDQQPAPAIDTSEQPVAEPPVEPTALAPAPDEQPAESSPAEPTGSLETPALQLTPSGGTQAEQAPPSESAQEVAAPPEPTTEQPEASSTAAKQLRSKKSKKAADYGKEKKLSALEAAAKVLGETGQPMSCQEMIEAMTAKNYWASPGGKTPAATLYSAILREITTKGEAGRFQKTERGKFALKAGA
ncbi:MAG TPA: HTH domain-containing protein [Gemmataceae bacterium]|jgi:hypothetical protein